jgi:MFS family permease
VNQNAVKNHKVAMYAWIVCGLAALFYCYEYLLRIEPSVMIPNLMGHFGVTAAGLAFVIAMYYYAYTPLQAVVGVLTDYFGPKKVLTSAIGFCVVGCLLFMMTKSLWVAAGGRFLIGVGSAFAFVGVLKLAAMWLPENRFAMFVGITTSLGMIGAMIGDIGLTWVVGRFGWQHILVGSAIFGALLIPIFYFFVHENKDKLHEDITHSNFREAIDGLVMSLKNRQLIYAGLIGCTLYLSLSVMGEYWGIEFLNQTNNGSTRILTSSMNSMIFLGWLIGGPFNGWLSDRLGTRRLPLIFGNLLAALSISTLIIWPHMAVPLKFIVLFSFGLFSSVEIICFSLARDLMPIKYAATALGVVNLFIMLGGMILTPLVGVALDLLWSGEIQNGVRVYSVFDYQVALAVIPVVMIFAMILSIKMKETYRVRIL